MALNVSAWSIRKPLPALLLFAALTVMGALSFGRLTVTDMPKVKIPIMSVTVGLVGAAPAQMETQVTTRVESAVSGIVGVKKVSSTVSEGQSVTTVEFSDAVPVDRALDDVRDAVSSIRGDLPAAASEPVVQRLDDGGGVVVVYAVEAPLLTPEAQSWLIDDLITKAVKSVRGVASVPREGGADREIRVELDPMRLLANGVTAAEVNSQLAELLLDQSGGRSEVGGQEQSLRIYGVVDDLAKLADLELRLPGGQNVALGDLGTIVDGPAEQRLAAFLNGEQVIAFGVSVASGYSAPEVAADVAEVLANLDADLPDVAITEIDSTIPQLEATYHATMEMLVDGAILAIVVVFLFLGDVRATVISAIAIPLSILPTFWVMSLLGFSLNGISLLAITLVTGVLVDDAIVEVENIIRHIRMGKSPYQAAVEAADEIGLAVVATTATIIAVFLPVSFIGGLVGQYFKQFGITIAVAVAFSLLVARLITPMLAAYFLKDTRHAETGPGPVLRWYARTLDWCLRWRFATAAAGAAIFVGSIWLAMQLPTGLFPEEDGSRSSLTVEMPPGVTLDHAVSKMLQISARLLAQPEVSSVYSTVGVGGDPAAGRIAVELVPAGQRDVDQRSLERKLQADLAAIPDVKVSFANGSGGREFALSLTGADGLEVFRVAEALEAAIRNEVPALQNVQSAASVVRPELRITPRPADAAALGVSSSEIARVVRIATMGDSSQNLAKLADEGRMIDIKVVLPQSSRDDVASLEALLLRGSGDLVVPMGLVADIGFGVGPSSIQRENRERQILIEADLAPGADLGTALAAVMALDVAKDLPKGVRFAGAGDAEVMDEVFGSFFFAIGAGLMLVLITLILLYSDLFQPVTVLLSLPLSVAGALLALLLTGHGITLPVVIGIMMLIGIVTKNAILLVDFAIEEMRRGIPRREALIDAGLKRAQPIVMTTVAMSAGMLPAALIGASGDGFRVPMAIAVIGGLVVSTVLSLVFVPAVFTYLDDLKRILAKLFGRLIATDSVPVQALPKPRSVPRHAEAAE